jgi:uncharacterized protein (TIGR00369 family)
MPPEPAMTERLAARNPAFEKAVRESFTRQGLLGAMGAWLTEVAPGRVVIELTYAARVSQQQGYFHGAAIGAIGDGAGGYAALSLMPKGSEVVTVEYKLNFLAAARGELLRAEGQVVKTGRTLSVARVELACRTGDKVTPCALMQATYMRVKAA